MKQIEINVECETTSSKALHVMILINELCVYDAFVSDHKIKYLLQYDPTAIQQHKFQLVLGGKRKLIDSDNDVDTCLKINKINFNDLDVIPCIQGSYKHDSNGFGKSVSEEFGQWLGADGVIEFMFYTPISYWFSAKYPF